MKKIEKIRFKLLKIIQPASKFVDKTTVAYARKLGVTVGENCRIYSLNFGSEPYLISLGDHVEITDNVRFITHDGGVWVFKEEDPTIDVFGKITIGSNVFVGINTIILPGVSIGNNVVVGAGSVVTKSFGDNLVIAGNPAKAICTLDRYEEKCMRYNLKSRGLTQDEKRRLITQKEELLMRK